MLPSRDYLRSHATNAAIAHVLMTSCSVTKTRQMNAMRMQQTTSAAASNHNNKTTASQGEEKKENYNETNDISFESKAYEDNRHNHHNHDNNNNDLSFVSTTRGDHVMLPVGDDHDRASEDHMSLMELICHRNSSNRHHHHLRGHRQGSSREMAIRVTNSGRDLPGELYGFPPVGAIPTPPLIAFTIPRVLYTNSSHFSLSSIS